MSRMTVRTPRGLTVDCCGGGPPLLIIHGAVIPDLCAPLTAELKSLSAFQIIEYYRRGYSGCAIGPYGLGIPEQARDASEALDHAAIPAAHVVGFSSGAHIAWQLAVDFPGRVHSLVLIEPVARAAPSARTTLAGLMDIVQTYQAGDRSAAVARFLTAFAGEDYAPRLDACLPPGWQEKAIAEAATYFERELPAALDWDFERDTAARLSAPVLLMHGTASGRIFLETIQILQSWLPHSQVVAIPGANHFSPAFAPRLVAEEVRTFIETHQSSGRSPYCAPHTPYG